MMRRVILGLMAFQLLGLGTCLSVGCVASRRFDRYSCALGSEAHPVAKYEVKVADGVLTDEIAIRPFEAPLWAIQGTVDMVRATIGYVSQP